MKTIYLIIGTRPEAIKMAPIFKTLSQKENLDVRLISTGQHQELLKQSLMAFGIDAYEDLGVMTTNQSLAQLTARLLIAMEGLFARKRPDLVLAHGDTTTCYSAALSCFYQEIPFFHVEAGLRTFDIGSPFPEEFNRQNIAQLANHHFAPDEFAKGNLLKENVRERDITVSGSTSIDAMKMVQGFENQIEDGKTILLTLHRRENSDALENIMKAIRTAAKDHQEMTFIFPVHPNPKVKELASSLFADTVNVKLTSPLQYPQFLTVMAKSSLILTDSGGVQEEAAILGKKVLLLRDFTERRDGIDKGTTKVIGKNLDMIVSNIDTELKQASQNLNLGLALNGSPSASELISDVVLEKVF